MIWRVSGGDDTEFYVIADSLGTAMEKWRHRVVDESDGELSLLDPSICPTDINLIAEDDQIIP